MPDSCTSPDVSKRVRALDGAFRTLFLIVAALGSLLLATEAAVRFAPRVTGLGDGGPGRRTPRPQDQHI
jgi:hypothetical protein